MLDLIDIMARGIRIWRVRDMMRSLRIKAMGTSSTTLPRPWIEVPTRAKGWKNLRAWEAMDCARRESLMVSNWSKALIMDCIKTPIWVETISLEPLISLLKKSNPPSKTLRSLAVFADRLETSVMSSCGWGWTKANTYLCKSRTLPVNLRTHPSSSLSRTD